MFKVRGHIFLDSDADIDKIDDPVKRNATISFIHNFGQMPKQVGVREGGREGVQIGGRRKGG